MKRQQPNGKATFLSPGGSLRIQTPRLKSKTRHQPTVPQGASKIAQRFNAGQTPLEEQAPLGRKKASGFVVPNGTWPRAFGKSSVETLGCSQSSHRDALRPILGQLRLLPTPASTTPAGRQECRPSGFTLNPDRA